MGLFSKKDKEAAGEDSNRKALFGNRKSNSSSPAPSNPYAQQAPPPYSGGPTPQQRAEKTPVPPGGYGSNGAAYGGAGAYGQDRFGGGNAGPSSGRAGGYGGMGSADDTGRQELFGNAAQRSQQAPPPPAQQSGVSGVGGFGGEDGGYGSYAERKLTAE